MDLDQAKLMLDLRTTQISADRLRFGISRMSQQLFKKDNQLSFKNSYLDIWEISNLRLSAENLEIWVVQLMLGLTEVK